MKTRFEAFTDEEVLMLEDKLMSDANPAFDFKVLVGLRSEVNLERMERIARQKQYQEQP